MVFLPQLLGTHSNQSYCTILELFEIPNGLNQNAHPFRLKSDFALSYRVTRTLQSTRIP